MIPHSMGVKPHTVWYHGTNKSFDDFKIPHKPDNGDSYGSGVYFTKSHEIADTYARVSTNAKSPENHGAQIYPVHLKLKKELRKKLTYSQIHNLITHAPNLDDSLTNFGDVNHEGKHKVLNSAVNSYHTHFDNSKDQLFAIQHDFYHHVHPQDFLNNVIKHTGADHHYFDLDGDPKGGVVVYHPSQIRSIHATFDKKKAKSTNITESFKQHLIKFYKNTQ